MTRPINLYTLSRIRSEREFNIIRRQRTGCGAPDAPIHEIESLRTLADRLVEAGSSLPELDGFYYAFHIPRIGKEFDLLKITPSSCLNIELKSQHVPENQILAQLLRNRHYLSHLRRRLNLFTVETGTMTIYKLTLSGELRHVSIDDLVTAVRRHSGPYVETIDSLFKASEYLVSPIYTPDKFIQGSYFLTQAQEQVKRDLLSGIEKLTEEDSLFFHITGRPGTGKTLLLYDIARTLSKNGRTTILYGCIVTPAQRVISEALENLTILSVDDPAADDQFLSGESFLLIDEAQRLTAAQYERLLTLAEKNGIVLIFSTDPDQVLTRAERERDITGKIKTLPLSGSFLLSERIRTNREIQAFIMCMKNLALRDEVDESFDNIEVNYAETTGEAQNLLEYYRGKGFVFINYTSHRNGSGPYAEYEEDFDVHHVIGQEFDSVVVLMDDSFYYSKEGMLMGVPEPDPDILYPNLFYQSITRARENLAIIVVRAEQLFDTIVSIIR